MSEEKDIEPENIFTQIRKSAEAQGFTFGYIGNLWSTGKLEERNEMGTYQELTTSSI